MPGQMPRKRKRDAGDSANGVKFLGRCGKLQSSFNEEDRISQLPDEILLLVCSFLTLKEAGITSVLSTRWRYLWASIPCLIFDASFFPARLNFRLSDLLKHEYARHVAKVVRSYKGHVLEEFRLHLDLTKKHKRFVDRCLKFAISKGDVRKLELDFNKPFGYTNSWRKMYTFPSGVAKATDGSLSVFRPHRPFKFLKSLCLRSVRMRGHVLKDILSNSCSALEMLTLEHVLDLKHVEVVGPSLSLKHLEIVDCDELEKIEIYDVKSLVSFKQLWILGDLFIRNLPCLTDLSIATSLKIADVFHIFSPCLCQLERLTICLSCPYLETEEFRPIYKIINLRELEIAYQTPGKDDLLVRLMPLIEASAPYLQKFVIRVYGRKLVDERITSTREIEKVDVDGGPVLEYLKVLEVAGYGGRVEEDEFISYVVDTAASLETIIVNTSYQTTAPWAKLFDENWKEVQKAEDYVRRHAKLWLEGIMCRRIHLVIQ